jgi:hypothetical protein
VTASESTTRARRPALAIPKSVFFAAGAPAAGIPRWRAQAAFAAPEGGDGSSSASIPSRCPRSSAYRAFAPPTLCLSRAVGLLVLCLLCLALARAGAAAPPAPTLHIGDLTLTPWQPSESYQGGAQSDARLDQPVQFWRAAVPLRDVFAELTRQTGVAFAFAAPQRDEPRLCVTLFLNPTQPPSLREVLAQLSWATGCTFGYREAGTKSYYLLWSSAGEGTAKEVAAQETERMQQFRTEWETQAEAQRRSAVAMLAEAKDALALSREDAVARYRGRNDALLLNLLDPGRRAAMGFLTGLSDADTKELFEGRAGTLSRPWSAWSPEQQAALTQALGLQGKLPPGETVSITIESRFGGALVASTGAGQDRTVLGRLRGVFATGNVWGDDEIALRRAVGEIQTPEQESAARDRQGADWQARIAEFQQQWTQRREQAMAAARALTPARESQLAALSLPDVAPESALWQLQEAVAKVTGLHVVSDCAWPPRFGFFRPPGALAAVPTALEALSAASLDSFAGFGAPFGGGQAGDLGLEWGDAGSFLRFRAQRMDMWRAALLPVAVQTQLDAWLEPYLDAAEGSPPQDTPLAEDLEKMSWLAGRLDDLQVRLGGVIPYEDPSDPRAARLQALRASTFGAMAMELPVLRWLATFTPGQWARARADGLQWGRDLTPDQQSTAISDMIARDVPAGRMPDVVVHLGRAEGEAITAPDGRRFPLPPGPMLKLTLGTTVVGRFPLRWTPWRAPGGPPAAPPT